jgi:hypothetical protein
MSGDSRPGPFATEAGQAGFSACGGCWVQQSLAVLAEGRVLDLGADLCPMDIQSLSCGCDRTFECSVVGD